MPEQTGSHLSIGEVLAHLQDEFPDVTVSKIRFLESQGLIDPERTPSGYRRFYGTDLERLRWILYQQREHFLPLRVIKERLDEFGAAGAPPLEASNGDRPSRPVPELPPRQAPMTVTRRDDLDVAPLTLPLDGLDPELGTVHPSDDEPTTSGLTRAELLRESGLGSQALDELESYGLLAPIAGRGEAALYDDEGLDLAQVGAAYYSRGVTARHLRMYQHFAEREALLFAQVLLPYRRQRNPTARARLQDELEELARLASRLRTAMLRQALRGTLRE
ncbi:MAG TPA: MerR family transcriptional regulator [Acidimicrobiia bacterium]|nr:MerR family transcriptional regulator [Acidimicrobiia bacterium]